MVCLPSTFRRSTFALVIALLSTVGRATEHATSSPAPALQHAHLLVEEAGLASKVKWLSVPALGHPEAFRIEQGSDDVRIEYGGPGGAFYAAQQLTSDFPVMTDQGAPDFNVRGAVLMMLSQSWAYQSELSPEVYPWFFDRDLMRRYLDTLASARLNTLILWSGHLFPHILELPEYPDASAFNRDEIRRNQEQFHWLTSEAAKRNISVLTHFYNIHISEHLAKAMDRSPETDNDPTRYRVPDAFVKGYYRTILARYFEQFPGVGLYICPGESLALEHQQDWFESVIFATAKASGKNPLLIIRDWTLDATFKAALPTLYDNLYSERKHNDETITSPWPDPRHEEWRGRLKGHIVNLHDPADATPYRVGSPRLIGEIIKRWKDSGLFSGGWFYPPQCWIWPDTLDRWPEETLPGQKPLSFERDPLWHLLQGRGLWKADRNPQAEAQWATHYIGRHFGNPEIGTHLVRWYDLTSPILPGLQNLTATRFGNFFPPSIATVQANVDDLLTYRHRIDDPFPEGPAGLTHQRYYSQPIDAYTIERHGALHGRQSWSDLRSMPVAQLAAELAAGRNPQRAIRPDHLLQTYASMAQEALAAAQAASSLPGTDPEERKRFVSDAECLVLTVKYYQLKVQAALAKRLYQLTGRKGHLNELETAMTASVETYATLKDLAYSHYREGTSMFHALTWEQTFESRVRWDRDLQLHWIKGQNR
ncbi:MAG: hypothetical protein RL648_1218 [Verrucomicrobiota bacterium]